MKVLCFIPVSRTNPHFYQNLINKRLGSEYERLFIDLTVMIAIKITKLLINDIQDPFLSRTPLTLCCYEI